MNQEHIVVQAQNSILIMKIKMCKLIKIYSVNYYSVKMLEELNRLYFTDWLFMTYTFTTW